MATDDNDADGVDDNDGDDDDDENDHDKESWAVGAEQNTLILTA